MNLATIAEKLGDGLMALFGHPSRGRTTQSAPRGRHSRPSGLETRPAAVWPIQPRGTSVVCTHSAVWRARIMHRCIAVLAFTSALTIGSSAHGATISVKPAANAQLSPPRMVKQPWLQLMAICNPMTAINSERRPAFYPKPSSHFAATAEVLSQECKSVRLFD
jgi:hypothetical protein